MAAYWPWYRPKFAAAPCFVLIVNSLRIMCPQVLSIPGTPALHIHMAGSDETVSGGGIGVE